MFIIRSGKKNGSSGAWTTLTRTFVLMIAGGCLVTGFIGLTAEPELLSENALLDVFPDAAGIEISREPFFHYRALDSSGSLMGAIIITDSIAPTVKGYLGEVGSAVGVTTEGRITFVVPVRHRETPYYMDMIVVSGLLEEMTGLDLTKPFPDIDTVSGATLSSQAIIRDVREASSRASGSLFGITVPSPLTSWTNPWIGWKTLMLAGLIVLTMVAGFTRERKRFREAVMILNLAGIGFTLNTPITLSALSRTLTLNLPGPENTLLIIIMLYILISIPVQGRAYCRLACPFGTLQEFLARLSPWQLTFSPGVLTFLPGLRHLVLGLLLFLAVWIGWEGFTEVEPFSGLFSLKLSTLYWVLVLFVLGISVFVRRFWCNSICPTGTLLYMLSRFARPGGPGVDETV